MNAGTVVAWVPICFPLSCQLLIELSCHICSIRSWQESRDTLAVSTCLVNMTAVIPTNLPPPLLCPSLSQCCCALVCGHPWRMGGWRWSPLGHRWRAPCCTTAAMLASCWRAGTSHTAPSWASGTHPNRSASVSVEWNPNLFMLFKCDVCVDIICFGLASKWKNNTYTPWKHT